MAGRQLRTAAILKRLPLRFSYDANHFHHQRQAMPREGYTALVETQPGEVLFAIRHNWRKFTPSEWAAGEGRSYIYPITLTPAS